MNNSPLQQSPTWLTPIFPQQSLFTYSKHSLFGRKKLVKHLLGSSYCFTPLQTNIDRQTLNRDSGNKSICKCTSPWPLTSTADSIRKSSELIYPVTPLCLSHLAHSVGVHLDHLLDALMLTWPDRIGPDQEAVSRISKPSQVFWLKLMIVLHHGPRCHTCI